MDKAIPWTKAAHKSKPWWMKEISALKKQLESSRKWARQNLADSRRKEHAKTDAARWRKPHRRAQWTYWEHILGKATPNDAFKVIKGTMTRNDKERIPDIQGIIKFQGKCDLR